MIEFTITDDFLKIFEDIAFSVNENREINLVCQGKKSHDMLSF